MIHTQHHGVYFTHIILDEAADYLQDEPDDETPQVKVLLVRTAPHPSLTACLRLTVWLEVSSRITQS